MGPLGACSEAGAGTEAWRRHELPQQGSLPGRWRGTHTPGGPALSGCLLVVLCESPHPLAWHDAVSHMHALRLQAHARVPDDAWEYQLRRSLGDAAYSTLAYVPYCSTMPVQRKCNSPAWMWVSALHRGRPGAIPPWCGTWQIAAPTVGDSQPAHPARLAGMDLTA